MPSRVPYDAGADEVSFVVGINGNQCAYKRIQDAIDAAADGDTLYIHYGKTYKETLDIAGKRLTLRTTESEICANSPSPFDVIVDADDAAGRALGGVMFVNNFADVAIYDLILEDGSAEDGGILHIENNSQVDLFNVTIRQGTASGTGGGVYVGSNATLNMVDTRIEENSADWGGGIGSELGNWTTIRKSVITNNQATSGGGIGLGAFSIYNINESTIGDNTATFNGGGISAAGETELVLRNTTISGNSAWRGGGISTGGNRLEILSDSSFCSSSNLPLNTYCSQIDNNQATDHGGGIDHFFGELSVSGTAFIDNFAAEGSGVKSQSSRASTYQNVLFADNHAASDYTVSITNAITVALNSVTFAGADGAALLIEDPTIGLTVNSTISWLNGANNSIAAPTAGGCNITSDGSLNGAIVDPQLVIGTVDSKYSLQSNSPAIDQCGNGPTLDVLGRARPAGTAYDMGAFERGAIVPLAVQVSKVGVASAEIFPHHVAPNPHPGNCLHTATVCYKRIAACSVSSGQCN